MQRLHTTRYQQTHIMYLGRHWQAIIRQMLRGENCRLFCLRKRKRRFLEEVVEDIVTETMDIDRKPHIINLGHNTLRR